MFCDLSTAYRHRCYNKLSFWHKRDLAANDSFIVEASIDYGSSWTEVWSYTYNTAEGGPFGFTLATQAITAGAAYLRPWNIRGEIGLGANWAQPFRSFANAAPAFQGLDDQYGLAADFVINKSGVNPWEDRTDEVDLPAFLGPEDEGETIKLAPRSVMILDHSDSEKELQFKISNCWSGGRAHPVVNVKL